MKTAGPHWAQPSAVVNNIALAVLGAVLVVYCKISVIENDHFVLGLSEGAFCQALLYIGAVWVVLQKRSNRWTFAIIITIAILCRLVWLFGDPFSSDVFRYVWDGRVQAHGINPYRYVPADEHLRFLRDDTIYPSINRADYAHTIYPPGSQMLFYLVTRITDSSIECMKLVMIGFEVLTAVVVALLLKSVGLPREMLLLYAWQPTVLMEIAGSGHVDSAAIAFMMLAILYRFRKQDGLVGLMLGVATLIKLFPIVLLPALYRRKDWKMPVVLVSVVASGYALYSSVGRGVFGFLGGYAIEEGLNTGDRYFLLVAARRLLHVNLPAWTYIGFAGACLGTLALWAYRKTQQDDYAVVVYSFAIASALTVLYSPHYSWYFLWLVPFLPLVAYTPMLYFITACFYLYLTNLSMPGEPMYRMNVLLYSSSFIVLVLYSLRSHFLRSITRANPHAVPASTTTPAEDGMLTYNAMREP